MKIILVQPKFNTHLITPPLGLGYLASSLIQDGHSVQLLDCVSRDIDVIKIIRDTSPDFIGITILSISYNSAITLIKEIKEYSKAKIVIGGSHVSALPEQSLKDSGSDFAIIGEGENTFRELCSNLNYKSIRGLAFWCDKNIVINQPRDLIKDIDSIPFPAWDIIEPNSYPPTPHGAFYKYFPIAPITTTRGCPYDCIFCASKCTWRQKLRVRSAKNVVDEIEYLHKTFGIREFHFEDDNFTFSKKHAMDVCNEILNRKLDIAWACPNGVRIDKLDLELITLMKKSGCYQLSFGIESGSQKIIDSINKHMDLKIVPEIIKMIKDSGIGTCGFFMVGLPEDTKETIEQTIDFSISVPFDTAQFSRFIPLPGTKPFDDWYKDNFDWNMINHVGHKSTYQTHNLTSEEITALQKKAFRKFYFRPKTIFKVMINMKPIQYYWFLKRIADYKLW